MAYSQNSEVNYEKSYLYVHPHPLRFTLGFARMVLGPQRQHHSDFQKISTRYQILYPQGNRIHFLPVGECTNSNKFNDYPH